MNDASNQQLFATLPPEERQIANELLQATPSYRYNLRGFPPLETIPEPGPASAAAAAKAMMAWIKSRRLD